MVNSTVEIRKTIKDCERAELKLHIFNLVGNRYRRTRDRLRVSRA